ncbi:hypothetical protein [Pontibacter beigongshangensis]|uniref:hypothetical protein n=1 Tax=Pontibacter beigongshangensis TaxID=2574733 RepID=UPI00164FB4A1|nr:hypothetical protein [Pontibacter beigongshangensis]
MNLAVAISTISGFFLLVGCLASCAVMQGPAFSGVTIHYVGEKLAATDTVAVFYDEKDVVWPHKVIGRMTNDIVLQYEPENVKRMMQEKAKEVGGDAIIITDLAPYRTPNELDKIVLKAIVIKHL